MNWRPLLLSCEVALLATLLAGSFGVAVAGYLATKRFRGSDLLEALLTVPMVLPPTVLGYYLLRALGRSSVVGRAYESLTGSPLVFSKTAAVLAGAIAAFPFVVRAARAAMDDVDPRLTGAAATLGAPPLRVFLSVTLPLARSGVMAGLTLGFARALGDFGVTLMVSGDIPGLTQTGSLAIYDAVQANHENEAAGLSLVMSAIAIVAVYMGTKWTRRRAHVF